MRTLVLATRNKGKVRELAAMLAELEVTVRSLDDFPEVPEVVEDGATFEDNALKKARTVAAATGLPALADDSGLEVEALGGEPGVYSARYGGAGLDDAGRCDHLLGRLASAGLESSPARFRSTVALVSGPRELITHGVWEGVVMGPPEGDHGFGYDPIFHPDGGPETPAMLPAEEKNRLSHRGQALATMLEQILADPLLLDPAEG